MFDQKKLDRINFFAKKSKEGTLNEEELKERDTLRQEYLEHFRGHFRSRLENIKVVTPEEQEEMERNKQN
ncbi:MAG: DUF896 domain-containing protein [Peptostreptococcaceae bacterium]